MVLVPHGPRALERPHHVRWVGRLKPVEGVVVECRAKLRHTHLDLLEASLTLRGPELVAVLHVVEV